MTTGEAAKAAAKALGCDLSQRDVDIMLRAWPMSELPPLGINGRRQWGPEHVDKLKTQIQARKAKAAS